MNEPIKYSAQDISILLKKHDPHYVMPSEEQIAIIEAPLEPAVVIAGAGSGKTETMGARVLYLVANKLVAPGEILGLTFTRKAAGELGIRVRRRLRQLESAEKIKFQVDLDPAIMTYHSYAGRLLGEHAIRCGVDAADEPMGEAAMWQMAAELVHNWPDEDFRSDSAISTVIKDVIGLSRLVLEHGVTAADITSSSLPILERLESIGPLSNGEVRRIHTVLNQRISILPMVFELVNRRRRDGTLTFDDQMSLAAKMTEQFADIGELERSRYKLVLLDEYQDTSQSQIRMLSALFGKGAQRVESAHPVMAVGDPCQAIYTWRGASAGTIEAFANNFPKSAKQNGRDRYSLSKTFRNDRLILDLANEISAEIRTNKEVEVAPLVARDDAAPGELACGIFETQEAEAIAVAEYIHKLWIVRDERAKALDGKKETFAILTRKRSQIPEIEIALRALDIPYEVLGVGGLVHVAEVADLISMLRIVTDPDAGSALMRQLTGPRLNLGPADIAALSRYSRTLAQNTFNDSKGLIAKVIAGNPQQEEADDQIAGSLIDALDEIDKAEQANFTAIGYARLSKFADRLRHLRSRAGGSLLDLIMEIENYLFLDVEVYLRDKSQSGRRHLDRFIDEAAKFARSGANVTAFLTWLDVASAEEGGLKSGPPEIDLEKVSILTIHMAKGLEWSVVAIPGLAAGTFPSSGREKENWLTNEKHIPFELRGDSHELPTFNISQCTSHADVKKVFDKFDDECDAFRYAEEIRLGYVAVTRAKTHLLCTTSRWRDGARPVEPSSIYQTIAKLVAQRGVDGGVLLSDAPAPADGAVNPQIEKPESKVWPRDPLGDRRAAFDAGVELVRSTKRYSFSDEVGLLNDEIASSWIDDAQALLNEIHQAKTFRSIILPSRLSVSALVALRENPAELALSIRRPMPRPQDEYSRRGTTFHLWVESYFGQGTLFDDEDLAPVDPLEEDQTLAGLKQAWLNSSWSIKTPHAVEVPFETVLAGVLVRGRIDAVYKVEDKYEVVDWKTGSKKLGEAAAIQLAMYRLAWAKLAKVDVEKVSAAFHYVPSGNTDRPADLLSEINLIALIENNSPLA